MHDAKQCGCLTRAEHVYGDAEVQVGVGQEGNGSGMEGSSQEGNGRKGSQKAGGGKRARPVGVQDPHPTGQLPSSSPL